MDERVWEKTAQFLKELRCEDTGRLSQLQLPEYQKAMKEKFSYQPIYEQTVCEMTDFCSSVRHLVIDTLKQL